MLESKKKAKEKYDKENMKYLSICIKKELAEKIDEKCKKENIKRNKYIKNLIEKDLES